MDSELSAWHTEDSRPEPERATVDSLFKQLVPGTPIDNNLLRDWRREPTLRDPDRFALFVDSAFDTVDSDKDGSLTKPEIEQYLRTPDVRGQARDAFEVLHNNFEAIAGLNGARRNPGKLNREAIAAFKVATAENVLDKSFYPKSMAPKAMFGAGAFAVIGTIGGLLFKGRAGIVYGVLGIPYGGSAGAVSGFFDAYNARQNRETVKSLDYFKLK